MLISLQQKGISWKSCFKEIPFLNLHDLRTFGSTKFSSDISMLYLCIYYQLITRICAVFWQTIKVIYNLLPFQKQMDPIQTVSENQVNLKLHATCLQVKVNLNLLLPVSMLYLLYYISLFSNQSTIIIIIQTCIFLNSDIHIYRLESYVHFLVQIIRTSCVQLYAHLLFRIVCVLSSNHVQNYL